VFSLDKIKAIKNSVPGTTVNDAVVAICGGALRRYLDSRGELPETSLVAMAPMSARAAEQMADAGNLVTAMSLPIRTDIADPLQRLMAISEESQQAKKLAYTMGPRLAADAAEFLPSTMSALLMRMYANARMSERVPPLFNTVITNVPGVSVPMYSMGSRLIASWGLGPVTHGLGLFQPVVSYNGTISIAAIADRDMMPDPAFYSECLQESFDELYAATVGKQKKPPKKKKKSASRKKAAEKTSSSRPANGEQRPDVH